MKYKRAYQKYKHLVVGGTFDLLHKGHEGFLKEAFLKSHRVTIGLTSDLMAAKKGNLFQNYNVRLVKIVEFLKKKRFENWQVLSIDNPFGTAIFNRTLDAILVSTETRTSAMEINKRRKTGGLKPLEIAHFRTILADDGERISSGRIKNGEITREGASFFARLTQAKKYLLPTSLRTDLAKPLGQLHNSVQKLVASKNNFFKLYVVGDASVANFLKLGIVPNLSIFDFKIQRKEVYAKVGDLGFGKGQKYQTVKNEPAEITRGLVIAIYKNLAGSFNLIKVDGEEDLAVLPLVLLAPLGAYVVYGQRNRGIVSIDVSEQKKSEFLKILELFQKTD